MTEKKERWWVLPLIVFSCFCVIAPSIFTTVYRPFKVPTAAMKPTILGVEIRPDGSKSIGDHIFVNKLAYWFKRPARGDIIVFSTKGITHPAVRQNVYYIKRIVGLPGETVSIKPPSVIVDGQEIRQPGFFELMASRTNGYSGFQLAHGTAPGPKPFLVSLRDEIRLGPDEYLVCGDNSPSSFDGRYYGPIKRDAIVGPAVFRYFPLERIGRIK